MKNKLHGIFNYLLTGCFLSLLVSGCASLPSRPELPHEAAQPPAMSGSFAALSAEFYRKNGIEKSGFRLITNGQEALEARLALADLAISSIGNSRVPISSGRTCRSTSCC